MFTVVQLHINSHVPLLSQHASQSSEEASARFEKATGAVC